MDRRQIWIALFSNLYTILNKICFYICYHLNVTNQQHKKLAYEVCKSRPTVMFISLCTFMGYRLDPSCLSQCVHLWVIFQTLHVYLIVCFHGLLSRPSMTFISMCAFTGYCLDPPCLSHNVLSWVIVQTLHVYFIVCFHRL